MVKRIIMLMLCLTLAVVVGYYFFWPVSDVERIEKQLSRLSECASKHEGEKGAVLALKAHRLGELFADQCEVEIAQTHLAGVYSPGEITSHSVRLRKLCRNMNIRFFDITVNLISEHEATVICTIHVEGRMKNENKVFRVDEIEAKLKKVDNKWLFTNFKLVKVLEK